MAISNADSVHREHRLLLKQELGRMVLFFTDQPTLLAPNLQVPTAFAPQEDLLHSFVFCFCFGFLAKCTQMGALKVLSLWSFLCHNSSLNFFPCKLVPS